MKIRFKDRPQDPTVVNGMKVDYAPGRRIVPRLRWYLILLLVSLPLLVFLYRLAYENLFVDARGFITPQRVTAVAAGAGTVSRIAVTAGENIAPGQLLVNLSDDLTANRLQYLRDKKRLLENIIATSADSYREEILQRRVQALREQLAFRRERLEDMEFLRQRGAATAADVEPLRYDLLETEAALRQVELELRQAGDIDLNQYRNEKILELDDLQSRIIALQQQLDDLNVRAGYAGKVVRLEAAEGEQVFAGDALLTVALATVPTVTAYLEPRFADYVQEGMEARARFSDGRELPVRVTRVLEVTDKLPAEYLRAYGQPEAMLVMECAFDDPQELSRDIMGLPVAVRLGNRLAGG